MISILILASSFVSFHAFTSTVHASSCSFNNYSYEVEGCLVDTSNSPVSGLNVYLIYSCPSIMTAYMTTDSNGYFSFQPTQINGNSCLAPKAYPVSVNGVTTITKSSCYVPSCNLLGQVADNPAWGQWVGDVTLGQDGYTVHVSVTIQVQPATIINVPVAALYSDNRFAELTFSSTTTTSISASFSGGVGVTYGYSSTYTNSFQTTYAIPYYCNGSSSYSNFGLSCSQGLVSIGVSAPVPSPPTGNGAYVHIRTSENLPTPDPNSPPQPSLTCPITGPQSVKSTNDMSNTVSFGITGQATFYDITATLSYTGSTTSGTSASTEAFIRSTDYQQLSFLFFPSDGSCPSPGNPTGGMRFGPVLHVWDTSPPPDYTMSASPSSLSIPPGSTGTSAISLTGFNGFNEQVSLTYSAPTGISVSLNPSSLFVSSTPASSNPVISVGPSVACGTNYPVTFTATSSGSPVIIHSATVMVAVNPACDFSISATPSSFSLYPGASVSSSISLASVNGFSGTVSLSASAPSGISVSFNPASVVLPPSSSSTATISVSSSIGAGTYTVTVTGICNTAPCSPTVSHSVQIQVQVLPDFTMSANPASVPVFPSNLATSTITVTGLAGFSGTVNLAVAVSPPSGLSCSLSPTSVALGNAASLTLTCSGTVGTYTVTVTGTSGSLSHSTNVAVRVTHYQVFVFPTELDWTCSSHGCNPGLQNATLKIYADVAPSTDTIFNLVYGCGSGSPNCNPTWAVQPGTITILAGHTSGIASLSVQPGSGQSCSQVGLRTDCYTYIQITAQLNGVTVSQTILTLYACHGICPV